MTEEKIVVVDFGGQYNQLIARRIRQLNVYSEVVPYTVSLEELAKKEVRGIIFTGGPNSVYRDSSPKIDPRVFSIGKPILGICYGAQLIAQLLGGKVQPAEKGEYGNTTQYVHPDSRLLKGVEKRTAVFMSHTDFIAQVPKDMAVTSHTDDCPVGSFEDPTKGIYATQFHPEVEHTVEGETILKNFVIDICGCKGNFIKSSFIAEEIQRIREQVKERKVLCALSGGVDSSVTAALLSKAIGKNLTCVFVDHGLLRKDEAKQVKAIFGPDGLFDLNFVAVDAADLFYKRLQGIIDPEQKRKVIGNTFIEVFNTEKKKLGKMDFLAQGTIYPDRIESGLGAAATIKSHHNVGGLPEDIGFKGLIEPLSCLFKDEVREIGLQLGLPKTLVYRQPFPGPGLGIRIIGEVTKEKVKIVQEADAIFREEVKKAGLEYRLSQYFAALSNMQSVGVMGDHRTYDYAVVLRAVETDDFMTARPSRLSYDLLSSVADRIVNEVKGVNRVLFDYTSKPPSTIEWE